MNSSLYPKLAATNLKKNASSYIPYIITCICCVTIYYMVHAIAYSKGISEMSGGEDLRQILSLGNYVIAIFSVVFLFYTNSFLIKRRKKELGLYSILGMEKKHIAKVLFYENLYTAVISLGAGLFIGVLFSKLMFLLLLNLLRYDVSIAFTVSFRSIGLTLLLFTCIFLLTMFYNIWNIRTANPVALLHGGNHGEKEPKTKIVLTFIGIASLSGGYIISLTVKSPLEALTLFFLAVILVIIGTYALFTAGSIALLKLLRLNKRYYYNKENFISISGMLYRMKQNAIGLSNICILSTMVLVTISTTVCLYIGKDDLLRARYPKDIMVTLNGNETDCTNVIKAAENLSKKNDVQLLDEMYYKYLYVGSVKEGSVLNLMSNDFYNSGYLYVTIIDADEYNRLENKNISLNNDEILLYSPDADFSDEKLVLGDRQYTIKEKLDTLSIAKEGDSAVLNNCYMVVSNDQELQAINALANGSEAGGSSYEISYNVKGKDQSIINFANELTEQVKSEVTDIREVASIHLWEQTFYMFYGGFLFVGMFLGAMFMMATVLIIYYKQISEGYDDHDRFVIMQKVGLSKNEVRRTIRKQIKMVFLLPLAGAVMHICFAFPVIKKLLLLFSLTNTMLFVLCTAGTVLVFTIVYAIVYNLTARSYYRLVEA